MSRDNLDQLDQPFVRMNEEKMNDAPERQQGKGITAKLACAVTAGVAVGALGMLAVMELMKKSASTSNDEIAPACNATNGTVSLQYGNGTVTDQANPMPVLTTVATLTCQQVLCNASAVADTFMGFAWKVYSLLYLNNNQYQYPIPNATVDQCRAFSQADLIADAQTGCRIRLVGNMLEGVASTIDPKTGDMTTASAIALQFS